MVLPPHPWQGLFATLGEIATPPCFRMPTIMHMPSRIRKRAGQTPLSPIRKAVRHPIREMIHNSVRPVSLSRICAGIHHGAGLLTPRDTAPIPIPSRIAAPFRIPYRIPRCVLPQQERFCALHERFPTPGTLLPCPLLLPAPWPILGQTPQGSLIPTPPRSTADHLPHGALRPGKKFSRKCARFLAAYLGWPAPRLLGYPPFMIMRNWE